MKDHQKNIGVSCDTVECCIAVFKIQATAKVQNELMFISGVEMIF